MMMAGRIAPAAALEAALADELVLASQLLADLAFELGSDETMLRRHLTSLQKIDRITQMQLAVADLLRVRTDGADPLAALTLEDMKDRIAGKIQAA